MEVKDFLEERQSVSAMLKYQLKREHKKDEALRRSESFSQGVSGG
jgi:hypothetical protein